MFTNVKCVINKIYYIIILGHYFKVTSEFVLVGCRLLLAPRLAQCCRLYYTGTLIPECRVSVKYDQQSVRHDDETEEAVVAHSSNSRHEQLSPNHNRLNMTELQVLNPNISHYLLFLKIASIIINIHLHKASIFVHPHVDKSIKNLKISLQGLELKKIAMNLQSIRS